MAAIQPALDGTIPEPTTDWSADCDHAIETMARRGIEFQAWDLVREGLIGEPAHPNQWGPRFIANESRGVIERLEAVPSKRKTVNSSLCRTWRGTPAYRGDEAA